MADKSEEAMWVAVKNALSKAIPTFAITSAAVFAANKYSATFRKSLGVSGKVALAITPPLFMFSLYGEKTIIHDLRNTRSGPAADKVEASPFLVLHQAANYCFDHTLICLAGLCTPMYAGILYHELHKPRGPSWKFSHAVIHTRVLGQAAAIFSLVTVFGAKEFMKSQGGKFVIPGEDADEPWARK
ncbi:hypothetical protein M885DRAFT_518753 [Pelagophyceae sp. CCMP2097]|nr:hypothetical protein M885DRAFT_518753 [Pelagophyceae sp. CCMP2097]